MQYITKHNLTTLSGLTNQINTADMSACKAPDSVEIENQIKEMHAIK